MRGTANNHREIIMLRKSLDQIRMPHAASARSFLLLHSCKLAVMVFDQTKQAEARMYELRRTMFVSNCGRRHPHRTVHAGVAAFPAL